MLEPEWNHEKVELVLYCENDGKLYEQKKAIAANLKKKVEAGKYDPKLAVLAWQHWVDAGAKQFVKENGIEMAGSFPPKVRKAAAEEISLQQYQAILAGDWGKLEVPGADVKTSKPSKTNATAIGSKPVKRPKIRISRIRLDRGGYSPSGSYYGIGSPLYCAVNPETGEELEFRASDRTGALKVIDLVFTDPKHKSVTERFAAGDVKRFVGG